MKKTLMGGTHLSLERGRHVMEGVIRMQNTLHFFYMGQNFTILYIRGPGPFFYKKACERIPPVCKLIINVKIKCYEQIFIFSNCCKY